MTLTLAQARDAAISVVDAAWKDAAAPTTAFPMLYDNVKGDTPSTEIGSTGRAPAWARTTVRVIAQPQTTQGARRRYESEGTITVQVFTPVGDGHTLGDAYVQVILDALRAHASSSDGLWFFDIAAAEIGVDGPWFQTNVGATFRWQELAP